MVIIFLHLMLQCYSFQSTWLLSSQMHAVSQSLKKQHCWQYISEFELKLAKVTYIHVFYSSLNVAHILLSGALHRFAGPLKAVLNSVELTWLQCHLSSPPFDNFNLWLSSFCHLSRCLLGSSWRISTSGTKSFPSKSMTPNGEWKHKIYRPGLSLLV